MTTYIPISTAQRLGAELRSAIDHLSIAVDRLRKIRAIMGTQIDAGDYTQLETLFGLRAGDGKSASYQIAVLLDAFDTNGPVNSLKDKLDQVLNQLG